MHRGVPARFGREVPSGVLPHFVKHVDLLKKLVAALLGIALESIEQFTVRNPEMPPEALGDKFCRLDINMTVNAQRIDLEI